MAKRRRRPRKKPLIAYNATRAQILKALGFRTYRAYLKSALWARIRATVFAVKGTLCLVCLTRRAMQVHHRRYDRDTMLGINIAYLMPICIECHEAIEFKLDGTKRSTAAVDRYLIGLIQCKKPGDEAGL